MQKAQKARRRLHLGQIRTQQRPSLTPIRQRNPLGAVANPRFRLAHKHHDTPPCPQAPTRPRGARTAPLRPTGSAPQPGRPTALEINRRLRPGQNPYPTQPTPRTWLEITWASRVLVWPNARTGGRWVALVWVLARRHKETAGFVEEQHLELRSSLVRSDREPGARGDACCRTNRKRWPRFGVSIRSLRDECGRPRSRAPKASDAPQKSV
jgi:hypothetical protein